ncbi:histidine--tRNA ligase [bacterium K02(2017)]|nr:histidine--tRNA ligase [bacterium K02(2017)]
MNDILPADIPQWHKLEEQARLFFSTYGFSEIRTPILESSLLFERGIGEDTQVVEKEMYTFVDNDGNSMSLRPEGTASVIRSYLQNKLSAKDAISKLYYMGPMFRFEKPQKGRFRQFHQIGLETIGTDSPYADAEVVILLDRLVKSLGINDYSIIINSIGTTKEREAYLELLQNYFNQHKESLCEDCNIRLDTNPLRIFDCKDEQCIDHVKDAPSILDSLGKLSLEDFETFKNALLASNVNFVIEPTLVRGLDYYEKTVFEFKSNLLGAQSAFAGGGRYNKLAKELGAKHPIPSVGASIGSERLLLLLQEASKTNETTPELSGTYFICLDEGSFSTTKRLLQDTRDAGIKSDMDFSVRSLRSQMRRANKLGFKNIILIGENEMSNGVVTIKDFSTGDQIEIEMDNLVSRLS